MFILLPVGHDQSLRKFPWVTASIIGLCTVVQIHRALNAPSDKEIAETAENIARLETQALFEHGQLGWELSPVRTPEERTFLTAFRAGDLTSEDDPLLVALRQADDAWAEIEHRDLAQRWGFRPAHGLSLNVILVAFVHGGWFHLVGNMLFLWLTGCNLEDRWGRSAFAAVYFTGSVIAAGAYALWHPGSPVPMVGASGAVAAAMGAFLICYRQARIQLWYFLWAGITIVRTGIFQARALIALPFWLAEQLLMAWVEAYANLGVAYSAHVGGFVFGAGLALALRRWGIEDRYLVPAGNKGVEWEEDPAFVQALELVAAKRHSEAIPRLRDLLRRRPDHHDAADEILACALEVDDVATVGEHAGRVLRLGGEGRQARTVELYRLIERVAPDVALDDRALATVVRAAIHVSDPWLAVRTAAKLLEQHPKSACAPGVLWDIAQLQEDAARRDLADKTLRALIDRYPQDPFAERARRKLSAS